MNRIRGSAQSDIARNEFEFECIREFSHSGMQLGADVRREERRERIRIAILRENKQDRCWRETGLTYGMMYRQVYGKPLDARLPELEEKTEPLHAMRAQLWGHRALPGDTDLEHATENDSL
jgi:hypothetical protein